jgi:hypothetical protein
VLLPEDDKEDEEGDDDVEEEPDPNHLDVGGGGRDWATLAYREYRTKILDGIKNVPTL